MTILDQHGNALPPSKKLSKRVRHVRPRGGRFGRDRMASVDTSPEWIRMALDRAEHGDMRQLVTLNKVMECKLPGYSAAMGQLKNKIGASPIRVKAHDNSSAASKAADAVKRVVDSDAFQLWRPDMLDSIGIGYSLGLMTWDDLDGVFSPVRFQHVHPTVLGWDSETMDPYLDLETGPEQLQYGRWIPHVSRVRSGLPIGGGMVHNVAVFYLLFAKSLVQWGALAEVLGLPLRVGYYNDSEDDDEIEELETALHQIGDDAVALLRKGMEIEIIGSGATSSGSGSNSFHESFLRFLQEMVLITVLGQTMTTSDGSSRAQAEVHERGEDAQVAAFAFQASATLRSLMIRPMIDLMQGPGAPAPWVHMAVEDNDDLKKIAEGLGPLVDRGLEVTVAEVLDRIGFPVPEDLDPKLKLRPVGGGSEPKPGLDGDKIKEAEDKAEKLAAGIRGMCEAFNASRGRRVAERALRPIAASLGYEITGYQAPSGTGAAPGGTGAALGGTGAALGGTESSEDESDE